MVTVFECQGRGSLHSHSAGWGALVPKLLETVADDPYFAKIVSNTMDTMVTAHIPRSIHLFRQRVRGKGTYNTRYALTMLCPRKLLGKQGIEFTSERLREKLYDMDLMCVPCEPLPSVSSSSETLKNNKSPKEQHDAATDELHRSIEFRSLSVAKQRAYMTMIFNNYHECGPSCWKGKTGDFGCRFAKPSFTPVPETRPVMLQYEVATVINDKNNKKKINVSKVSAHTDIAQCSTHMPQLELKDIGNIRAKVNYVKQLMMQDPRFLIWELQRPFLEDFDEVKLNTINGRITEFNDALAAVTSCNQAIYSLGSAEQCKNIIYYMLDYMVKNSTKVQNCCPLIVQAVNEAKKYPSKAADSGTDVRNAQYFLNKVINKLSLTVEISASMAAASNMGLTSSIKSHETWYIFNQPAVALLTTYCSSLPPSALDDESYFFETPDSNDSNFEDFLYENGGDNDDDDDDVDQHLTSNITEVVHSAVENLEVKASLNQIKLSDDAFLNSLTEDIRHNTYDEDTEYQTTSDTAVFTAQIYRINGKSVPVAQHQHYSKRGPSLSKMNFYEWVSTIKIVQYDRTKLETGVAPSKPLASSKLQKVYDTDASSSDSGSDNDELNCATEFDSSNVGTKVGRKLNTRFFFEADHVLYNTHCQVFRSKFAIPELCGRRPPRFPNPAICANLRQESDNFARYSISLLVPWRAVGSTIEISSEINGDAIHSTSADTTGTEGFIPLRPQLFTYEAFCNWAARNNPSFIHRMRIRFCANMSQLFTTNYIKKQVCQTYRHIHATKWNERGNGMSKDKLNIAGVNWDLSFNDGAVLLDVLERLHDPNGRQSKQEEVLESIMDMINPMYDKSINNVPDSSNSSSSLSNYSIIKGSYMIKRDRAGEVVKNIEDDYKLLNDDDTSDDELPNIPVSESMYFPGNVERVVVERETDFELNVQQNKALTAVVRNINAQFNDPSVQSINILIHGGPGTGKSFFANRLLKILREKGHNLMTCAPTGVAASNLDMGRTIHNLFMFNPASSSNKNMSRSEFEAMDIEQNLKPLEGKYLIAFKNRVKNCNGFIIDEISFISADILHCIDMRLRQATGIDAAFGNKIIVAMGDMYQLPPVGGKALFCSALEAVTNKKSSTSSALGVLQFQKFILIPFVEQKRLFDTDDNAIHAKHIVNMRQNVEKPVTEEFLNSIKVLSGSDFEKDPSWLTAPIAVTNNSEKARLDAAQILRFATQHNLPCLRWRKTKLMAKRGGDGVCSTTETLLFDHYPELYNYFVPGAPCYVTENIHATLGIANGTSCFMHSLTFESLESEQYVDDLLSNAKVGTFADIENRAHFPVYINCEFTSQRFNDVLRWPEIFTVVKGKVVIPIRSERRPNIGVKVGKDKNTNKRRNIYFKGIAVVLAFAITYHKLQGKTLPKLILDINYYSGLLLSLNFHMFYVGSTRVRSCKDMRFLPVLDNKNLNHLIAPKFRVGENLVSWLSRYNKITGKYLFTESNEELAIPKINVVNNLPTALKKQPKTKKNPGLRKFRIEADTECSNCTAISRIVPKVKIDMFTCRYCFNPNNKKKIYEFYCNDCQDSNQAIQHVDSCSIIEEIRRKCITLPHSRYNHFHPKLVTAMHDKVKLITNSTDELQQITNAFSNINMNILDCFTKNKECGFFTAIVNTIKAHREVDDFKLILSEDFSALELQNKVVQFIKQNKDEKYRPYNMWSFNVYYEATRFGTTHSNLSFAAYVEQYTKPTIKYIEEIIIQGTARFLKRTISCFMTSDNWNDWLDYAPLEFNESLSPICIGNVAGLYFVGSSPKKHVGIKVSESNINKRKSTIDVHESRSHSGIVALDNKGMNALCIIVIWSCLKELFFFVVRC